MTYKRSEESSQGLYCIFDVFLQFVMILGEIGAVMVTG